MYNNKQYNYYYKQTMASEANTATFILPLAAIYLAIKTSISKQTASFSSTTTAHIGQLALQPLPLPYTG